jgi:hypothetical protein
MGMASQGETKMTESKSGLTPAFQAAIDKVAKEPNPREAMLSGLAADVCANHPGLTPEEAQEMIEAFGGWTIRSLERHMMRILNQIDLL